MNDAMNRVSALHMFSIKPIPFVFGGFMVFIFALVLCACRKSGGVQQTVQQTPAQGSAQTAAQGSGQDQTEDLQDLQVRLTPHKGDIDEMDKLREVRALVSFNKAGFFFDKGRPRGMTYDALLDFETFLNRKLHPKDRTGKEKIHVVLVPTTAAKVASDLLNGNGDIVAVAVYITESRKKVADFIPARCGGGWAGRPTSDKPGGSLREGGLPLQGVAGLGESDRSELETLSGEETADKATPSGREPRAR
jgi:hypothetical protein